MATCNDLPMDLIAMLEFYFRDNIAIEVTNDRIIIPVFTLAEARIKFKKFKALCMEAGWLISNIGEEHTGFPATSETRLFKNEMGKRGLELHSVTLWVLIKVWNI